MGRILGVLVAVAAAVGLCQCSAGAVGLSPRTITLADNQDTVTVLPRTMVRVTLRSVIWQPGTIPAGRTVYVTSPWEPFTDTAPTVLQPVGDPTYTLTPTSTPGRFIGHSTMTYRAPRAGSAVLGAQAEERPQCGAGIYCYRYDVLRTFTVTVTVG